ncbi:MAG TPA: fructosamine kinase, partial [Gammaproteobacteria bacterium]|nr:fructosamine kinase [Gammaproteobacteria bacterium]HAO97749.1 fructosamine kinase [Gammaproteobacteria bacterium]HAZ34675.1 fructosamine kinase [Gammaproteobacteria bacterium]HCF48217.1 fructosamine kinase [Gammaproteobacteria bacterium]
MSIEAHIEQHLGLSIINKQSVSTGLFSAYQVTLSNGNTVFVKYQSHPNQQLINEGRELALLGRTIHTPTVLGSCEHCLILEWIDTTQNANMQSQMGLALANLHQNTGDYFGFEFDNKIGKTPQPNGVGQNIDNWADFYWEYRLLHQITLAHQNTLISQTDYQQLLQVKDILPNLLDNTIKPTLLHGDLWSGNVLSGKNHPYFIDTASYYGHREIDFALTFMFGGFDNDFYQ